MKTLRTMLIATILFYTSVFCAQAEDGWKKIGELDGIIGYTHPSKKSSVDEVKAVGMINAPLPVVEAVIRDTPSKRWYMYKCKEAGVVTSPELKSSRDVVHTYTVTHMPAPVKDRYVVTRSEYTIDKATGTLYVHSVSVNMTYELPHNPVRMPLVNLDYIITPKGPDQVEFTYIGCADPGGHLPAWLVNMLTKNIGIRTIAGIREMVKQDKYRAAKTIVTSTAH